MNWVVSGGKNKKLALPQVHQHEYDFFNDATDDDSELFNAKKALKLAIRDN